MDPKLDSLEEKVNSLVKVVVHLSKQMVTSNKTIDSNFEVVNKKLDHLMSLNIGDRLDGLKEEIQKIQKVSHYSEEYENLLNIVN